MKNDALQQSTDPIPLRTVAPAARRYSMPPAAALSQGAREHDACVYCYGAVCRVQVGSVTLAIPFSEIDAWATFVTEIDRDRIDIKAAKRFLGLMPGVEIFRPEGA